MATEGSSSCQEPKMTSQTHLPADDSLLLPDLLPEIIVEILSTPPVKSLLRLRCVSKSWRSIISQPEFAKTHLCLASMSSDYTHHRLLLRDLNLRKPTDVKSCSLYRILNEQSDTAVDLDCPLKSNHLGRIGGCCDGLVCGRIDGGLIIWNPSTRRSKRLPDFEMPTRRHYITTYGFGYDESIDDYKVAVFSRGPSNSGFHFEIKGEVYSLRTNSWRRIGSFPYGYFMDISGTYLNGALHWTVTVSRESNIIIVSLDLAKETYREVLLPDYGDGHLSRSSLDVLNGCLRIVCAYDEYIDVWVMKEYGIRESWTKLVVIPCVTPELGDPYPTPVCILKNGEFLVNVYTHLVRYNPKDGTTIYLPIRNCSEQFSVYRYIESLISPEMDADIGVQWQHQY